MERLIFATNNPHKLQEVAHILKGLFEVVGMNEAGFIEDIPENELTLEGNAKAKAQFIYSRTLANVFADDTGLEIESLNGEPGVFSARYAGQGKSSEDNLQLVLQKMESVGNRKAQFRTTICLILNNKEYLFEGIIKGIILTKKQGASGFGYDPIFQPDGYSESFAQMPMELKNQISHRGLATKKMVEFLIKGSQ